MQDNQTYINLARKYRPQVIADLIGQDALVQTLSNAFKLNRIHHAFMLTGIRGTGKTTTARIIAKALNCTGSDDGGITLNPCGVCESCISINNDSNMDVIEMDAASRTGVDDVREIIENAKYKPVSSRYKIFIIDEVHMLSKNAFNALLKTLEEPPQHLKFIFATTEIRKVPITVLSRCQRFDLKRVSTSDLSQHLEKICEAENISFDSESLFLLAKGANGSVRDSLSLLDQAIVYTDRNLAAAKIIEMLGAGAKEDTYNLFLNIINKDNIKVFELLNQQFIKGIELDLLLEDMLEICHNTSLIKITNNPQFLDVSEIERKQAAEIAGTADLPTLVKLWQIILRGIKEVKDSGNSLIFANMIFSKMLLVSELGDVGKMIDFLKSSEKKNSIADKNPNGNKIVLQNITPIVATAIRAETTNNKQNSIPVVKPQTSFEDIPPAEMEDYGIPASSSANTKPAQQDVNNTSEFSASAPINQKTNTLQEDSTDQKTNNPESNTEEQKIKADVLHRFPTATFVRKEVK